MKLCFTGPILDFSGFAHAARGMLRALHHSGVDLVARPITYDKADSGNGYEMEDWLKPLVEKPLEGIDMLLQCTTANIEAQPKPGVCNGLYTFFEFDRIPVTWARKVNEFDFIIVPCIHNAETLMRCGCQKPILVMTTAFDVSVYTQKREPLAVDGAKGRTVFYNICQLSAKKGLDLLLRSYYAAFADRPDDVLLVLKTYINMRDRRDERKQVINFINSIKQGCNLPIEKWPPVKVITGVMSDEDVQRLHAMGGVYVNSSRGEGFCLPAFEAMAHGNTVISSMTGGMREYVSPETALVFNAMPATVYDMAGHDSNLCNGVARWFEPSTAEMADIMRSYHLMRIGHDAGELNEENEGKWQQIQDRARAGEILTKQFDYQITGPKLKHQLDYAMDFWRKNGHVAFAGQDTNESA